MVMAREPQRVQALTQRLVIGRDRALRNVRRATTWVIASATVVTGGLVGLATHETTLHAKSTSSSGQSQSTSTGVGATSGSQAGGSSAASASGGSGAGGSGSTGSSSQSSGGSVPSASSGPAQAVTGQT